MAGGPNSFSNPLSWYSKPARRGVDSSTWAPNPDRRDGQLTLPGMFSSPSNEEVIRHEIEAGRIDPETAEADIAALNELGALATRASNRLVE